MKIAVIDMGTNTFHLLIVEVKDGDFNVLYREKSPVKIGEKGINKGFITDDAIGRALDTLKVFRKKITESEILIENVYATATSAIRNAKNGSILVNLIEKETQIKTNIISGLQEAELIYFGVNQALKIGNEPALIMDIGGGSIEFIIGTDDKIDWKQSFEIGGQRMVEKFHKTDPISKDEITALEKYLFDSLQELFEACAKFRPSTLIGSSGTFDTLSEIYQAKIGAKKVENATELPLTIDVFREIFHDLIVKNRDQRLKIPGMIPMRVDMIVVAVVLVKFIIDSLDIKQIRVSAYALKEGVLLKTLHSLFPEISTK